MGYDAGFFRGHGQSRFARAGLRYLDLLSGWGVFGIGRNHPIGRGVLTDILDHDLPNLVQMDVSPLAALLAERLLQYTPFLQKAFFTNSGAEAVEAAIKFARRATGRSGLVHCAHGFHGLSYGPLSLNGEAVLREGFGPDLPDFHGIPFVDFPAPHKTLTRRQVAPFSRRPTPGKR